MHDNSKAYDKENICNKNLAKVENANDTSFEFSMMRRRSIDEVRSKFPIKCFRPTTFAMSLCLNYTYIHT